MGRRREHGDTIVEVIFSFAVFSLVIVSAIVIMNQGVATAQRSLEVTLVRQQIDSQVSMLLQAQQSNSQAWQAVKSKAVSNVPAFTDVASCPSSTDLSGAQFLGINSSGEVQQYDANASNFASAPVYSRVDITGEASGGVPRAFGLWFVLAQAENADNNRAYDLHVRACWDSVGSQMPVTIGTVVRLYAVN